MTMTDIHWLDPDAEDMLDPDVVCGSIDYEIAVADTRQITCFECVAIMWWREYFYGGPYL